MAGFADCRAFRSATHDSTQSIMLPHREETGSIILNRLAGNLLAPSDTLSRVDDAKGMGPTGLFDRSLQTRKFRISRPRSVGTIGKHYRQAWPRRAQLPVISLPVRL